MKPKIATKMKKAKIMRRRGRRVRMNESGANDVGRGQFSGKNSSNTKFAKQDVFLKSKATSSLQVLYSDKATQSCR